MENTYETQSLYEGAFLLSKGCPLAGKRNDGLKVTLLFEDTKKVQTESLNFYNSGIAEAKKLFDSYRTLKDYVFKR